MTAMMLALLAGVATVIAPCTLPILPILLGGSLGQRSAARPAFIALGFVTAFAGVAIVFSVFTHAFGLEPNTLRTVATVLLIVFGMLMVWPHPFERLAARASAAFMPQGGGAASSHAGNLGGLVLGATLGVVWTPCAGPVLGSILTLLATSKTLGWTATLLTLYAAGAALPMLAIAYGGRAATTRVKALAPYTPRLQQGFGVLVIGFAVAMLFDYDQAITLWLSDFYPTGQIGL